MTYPRVSYLNCKIVSKALDISCLSHLIHKMALLNECIPANAMRVRDIESFSKL